MFPERLTADARHLTTQCFDFVQMTWCMSDIWLKVWVLWLAHAYGVSIFAWQHKPGNVPKTLWIFIFWLRIAFSFFLFFFYWEFPAKGGKQHRWKSIHGTELYRMSRNYIVKVCSSYFDALDEVYKVINFALAFSFPSFTISKFLRLVRV